MAIDFPSSPTVGQTYTFGGVSYTFTAQGIWAVSGAQGTSATATSFIPTGNIAATNVQTAIVELDNEKVAKAGDTMTGGLVIAPAAGDANLVLNKAASGNGAYIHGQKGGLERWRVDLGDSPAESGGNAGSNFAIPRFNDAGAYIDTPLSIIRSTGIAAFSASPTAPTPAAGDNSTKLATTAYVVGNTASPQCGRLTVLSTTVLSLVAWNGNLIKINGILYTIPAAGVLISNSGLSPNATYYCYAQQTGGTLNLAFSTTGHTRSTTPGNVGTEILAGSDVSTLVGVITTGPSTEFIDTPANRYTLSWFNRRNLSLQGGFNVGGSTQASAPTEINGNSRANFLTWAEEAVHIGLFGLMYANSAGAYVRCIATIDTSTVVDVQGQSATANQQLPIGGAGALFVAEGWHYTPVLCSVPLGGAVTGTFQTTVTGMIRG